MSKGDDDCANFVRLWISLDNPWFIMSALSSPAILFVGVEREILGFELRASQLLRQVLYHWSDSASASL
jgi:hypothetical protein